MLQFLVSGAAQEEPGLGPGPRQPAWVRVSGGLGVRPGPRGASSSPVGVGCGVLCLSAPGRFASTYASLRPGGVGGHFHSRCCAVPAGLV